jgi:hypothetical protein
MKKTNLILAAILAILGSAVAWHFATKSDNDTSIEGYDFNFAVRDTANVGKIFIADRTGKTATLTRISPSEWQINGKFKAMPNVINNLLDVVARIELKYRLPRNAVKSVVEDMASRSKLVKVFDKNGKPMRSYYVGGVDMDGLGTYLMMEGSNEPYATHIPNFEGSPAVRYLTEELDWRDRWIFKHSVDDIQEVSIDYPLQKSKAFRLKRDGGQFNVEPMYPVTPRSPLPANQGLVEAFLIGFRALGSEGFENDFERKDSVRAVMPFAIVSLTDRKGKMTSISLHPVVKKAEDGTTVLNTEGTAFIERYFGDTNDGDFLLVQQLVFQKIFWAYEGFFGQVQKR